MRIGYLLLPCFCVTSLAMAADEDEKRVEPAPTAATIVVAPAHFRIEHNKRIRLPGGDVRQCLALKSNAEIIRCAESKRKK